MNKIYFEIVDDVVIKHTPVPQIGENIYKTEVVMTKEIFQECYIRWVEQKESCEKYEKAIEDIKAEITYFRNGWKRDGYDDASDVLDKALDIINKHIGGEA